jgi:ADP-ribosyl-[dinitrogen reductase] hydrolase
MESARTMSPSQTLHSRNRGILLGLAVGDALGGPVEFMTREAIYKKYGRPVREMVGGGWLKLKPGGTTDDTAMARIVAESIVERERVDTTDIARRYVAWMQSEPPDIGNITRFALRGFQVGLGVPHAALGAHRQTNGKSAGNGTIMRCAPIAMRYWHDERRLIDGSREEALITHFDPQAWTGSVAINMLIARLLRGMPLTEAIADVGARVRRIPRASSEVAEIFERSRARLHSGLLSTTGYVLDTLHIALWAVLGYTTFEETVVAAVNLGGDADTQGAVVGAIAGALYGVEAIPARWLERLEGHDELVALSDELYAAADNRRLVMG